MSRLCPYCGGRMGMLQSGPTFMLRSKPAKRKAKKRRAKRSNDIGGSSQVENDCEDQGFTLIKDGCFACLPDFDAKGKRVRPKLEKLERDGKWWWTCPKCKGSYGAARTPRIRTGEKR